MDAPLATPLELPRWFGRYQLLSLLGEGGMGRVYAAELHGPAGFRKRVAIKVLRPELSVSDAQARAGLATEARLGGLLSHPNVVETYELGEEEGQLFVAMAWVEGWSLHDVLARCAPLPARAALEVAVQICAGLAHIHGVEVGGKPVGLVHRDLKPPNILIDRTGLVRVADLGIAALRDAVGLSSDRRGTPAYMSPEQILGDALDARSDLFSLGSVIYEMFTGRRVFFRATASEIMQALLRSDVVLAEQGVLEPLDLAAPGLGDVVRRVLATNPDARPPNARTLHHALHALLHRASGPALHEVLEGPFDGVAGAPSHSITWHTAISPGAASGDVPRPPTNLGAELDVFVGRGSDLAALHERLDRARLVTLKGAGGTGKTRLSRRYGAEYLDGWPGGVWFCDLTEARGREEVLFAVSQALSVPFGKGDEDALVAQLGRALGARGRLLMILDNFEQVVDHAADTVGAWLADAPEVCFLVTSRERLRLAGEDLYELDPLTADDAERLLLERAGREGAWSASTAATAAIVRRLDQLPLAIELAAARARLMSPAQLLSRLDQSLKILRGGRRGVPARQATLRGAIDWSWNLLEPWEQATLAQLSVFRGGFHLDDAEEVLDVSAWSNAPWEVDIVGSLFDKSLLVSRTEGAQPRFRLYETIRAYAAERLEASDPVRDRHAAHYARLGEPEARAALHTGTVVSAMRRLAREIDNLVAGCRHALSRGQLDVAGRCGIAASDIFARRGPLSRGLALVEAVLDADPSPEATLELLDVARALAMHGGGSERALAHARRGLELARALGTPAAVNRALKGLGSLLQARGAHNEAMAVAQEALAGVQATGGRRELGSALGLVGRIYTDLGRLADAEAHMTRAVAIARELDDLSSVGTLLVGLGLLYQHLGRIEEAHRSLLESIDVLGRIEERFAVGRAHGNLGILLRRRGLPDEARQHYETALRIYREVGSATDEAIVLSNLGILFYLSGDHAQAEEHYHASIAINSRVGNKAVEASNLCNLANLKRADGALDEAERFYSDAMALYRDTGNRHYEGLVMGDLAILTRDRGHLLRANEAIGEAIAVLEEVGDQRMIGAHLRYRADMALQLGDGDQAERDARRSEALLAQVGAPDLEGMCATTLAEIALSRTELDVATACVQRAITSSRRTDNRQALTGALCTAARVLLAQNEPAEALVPLAEAHRLIREGKLAERGRVQSLRAAAHADLGDAEQARRCFEESVALTEASHNALGAAYCRLLRAEKAAAIGLDPTPDLDAVEANAIVAALPPASAARSWLATLRAAAGGPAPRD